MYIHLLFVVDCMITYPLYMLVELPVVKYIESGTVHACLLQHNHDTGILAQVSLAGKHSSR